MAVQPLSIQSINRESWLTRKPDPMTVSINSQDTGKIPPLLSKLGLAFCREFDIIILATVLGASLGRDCSKVPSFGRSFFCAFYGHINSSVFTEPVLRLVKFCFSEGLFSHLEAEITESAPWHDYPAMLHAGLRFLHLDKLRRNGGGNNPVRLRLHQIRNYRNVCNLNFFNFHSSAVRNSACSIF